MVRYFLSDGTLSFPAPCRLSPAHSAAPPLLQRALPPAVCQTNAERNCKPRHHRRLHVSRDRGREAHRGKHDGEVRASGRVPLDQLPQRAASSGVAAIERNQSPGNSEMTTPAGVRTPPTVATSDTSPAPSPAGMVRLIWYRPALVNPANSGATLTLLINTFTV